MGKTRLFLIMCAVILVATNFFPMIGAEHLEGSIDVRIKEYVGLVCPTINITNQSIALHVEDNGDGTYAVNDTLEIALSINDTSGRKSFILPRSVLYSVVITRPDESIFPLRGIFSRLLPFRYLFKSVNVADSMLGGKKNDTMVIPLHYTLTENITEDNLTLHLIVMGFISGDVNGVRGFPIVNYGKITLSVSYLYL